MRRAATQERFAWQSETKLTRTSAISPHRALHV